MVIRARARSVQAACPGCGVFSGRVHSRYVRRLADRPAGGRPVEIALRVRRFRCRERACSRATFAEQIDGRHPAGPRRVAAGPPAQHRGSVRECLEHGGVDRDGEVCELRGRDGVVWS
ncbi:transposase family protein [Streptomyces sp. NPDC058657]|uniref:transposase family protein n=1 Tax=Streptomyces sp. NPDC058657 TaxID=3346579 RepID=UPI003655483D